MGAGRWATYGGPLLCKGHPTHVELVGAFPWHICRLKMLRGVVSLSVDPVLMVDQEAGCETRDRSNPVRPRGTYLNQLGRGEGGGGGGGGGCVFGDANGGCESRQQNRCLQEASGWHVPCRRWVPAREVSVLLDAPALNTVFSFPYARALGCCGPGIQSRVGVFTPPSTVSSKPRQGMGKRTHTVQGG